MYSLWLVSEDSALPRTLGPHLRGLGSVSTGPPEASHWKERDAPSLVVVAAAHAPDDEAAALERLLAFLYRVPHPHRAPPPLLYIESPDRRPPAQLVRSLVDDRTVAVASWPIDPARLAEQAAALITGPGAPPSLRERARRDWVMRSVELLYADLELVSLRQAIDPRNAARPVLLIGEPGTRRGLLARYIHNLAEPARDRLITLPAAALHASEVESQLFSRSAGHRATVFLQDLDRAELPVQEELAQLLAESGALGIEPMRWIGSVGRAAGLVPTLRELPWIRVPLPSLRERKDLAELARGLARAWSERSRRPIALGEDALAALAGYVWPGNLRELEAVLDASLSACAAPELAAGELRFVPGSSPAPAAAPPAQPAEVPGTPAAEPEPYRSPSREPAAAPAAPAPEAPQPPASVGGVGDVSVRELVSPLTEEIRQPLLALRTCASLLEQRPEDADLRREFAALVEGDLGRLEALLQRLERFASFDEPKPEPVDLATLVASELDPRQPQMRERALVVLRELDHDAPPALADPRQLSFALGALLDRALRMVPEGGDLYVGSLHHGARADVPAGHRLLIRFHSPEEVLVGPADLPGPGAPIEVALARVLIEHMGGAFAVDASGIQDNVILIELPA